jgi:hypothetical protein
MIVRLLAVFQIQLYVQKIIRFSMVPDEGPFTDTIRFSLLKGNQPAETVVFHLNCIEPNIRPQRKFHGTLRYSCMESRINEGAASIEQSI